MWREELGDMDDPYDNPRFADEDAEILRQYGEENGRLADERANEIADIIENF